MSESDNSTAGEYVRELIRADQKREAADRLESLLLEGLESGFSPLTQADWEAIRTEVQARVKKSDRR